MVVDLLASKEVPVIYEHTFTQPARDTESYDVHFTAPEVLHKAGVPVVFTIGPSSFNAPLAKNLPYEAAQAVAFGLPETEALKGLTLYPPHSPGWPTASAPSRLAKRRPSSPPMATSSTSGPRSNACGLPARKSASNRHTRLYEKYKHRPKPKYG